MGLRILVGRDDGDSNGKAVLYCSTSGTALPWMFEDEEDAEAFLEAHDDVRRLGEEEQKMLFDVFYKAKRRATEAAARSTPKKGRSKPKTKSKAP